MVTACLLVVTMAMATAMIMIMISRYSSIPIPGNYVKRRQEATRQFRQFRRTWRIGSAAKSG